MGVVIEDPVALLQVLREQRSRYGHFLELFQGGSGYRGRWFITYVGGEVCADLVDKLIKKKQLFPVYRHGEGNYWAQPFSIDLKASRAAWEEGRNPPEVLCIVKAETGETALWQEEHSFKRSRFSSRGEAFRWSQPTPRQKLVADLYKKHKSVRKVADVLGCTSQNVSLLLKAYVRRGGLDVR